MPNCLLVVHIKVSKSSIIPPHQVCQFTPARIVALWVKVITSYVRLYSNILVQILWLCLTYTNEKCLDQSCSISCYHTYCFLLLMLWSLFRKNNNTIKVQDRKTFHFIKLLLHTMFIPVLSVKLNFSNLATTAWILLRIFNVSW